MKTFTLTALPLTLVLTLCTGRLALSERSAPTKTFNILAFLPTDGKSHFIGFKPLLETLVNRGHNVTLVSPYSLDRARLPYRFVEVERTSNDLDMLNAARILNLVPTPVRLWWLGPHVSETALNKPSVTRFVRGDRSSFDVVLFENFFHECFAAVGHKYGAPLVQLLPFATGARVSQWHGNPYHPAYIPDMASHSGPDMSLAQRASNAASAFVYTALNRAFYLPRHRRLADRYFVYPGHERRPDLADMLRNVSLTLVNSHPVIGAPAPMVPGYVNVAGMHCVPSAELPRDLKRIMDESGRGAVYFSLGSVMKASKMPNETAALLLSEFSKIEQTVLWKWEADDIPRLPKNVIIRKWFPQNDVLGHPNCKLFVTHGGVHSIIESLYHGVPMLAIPVFGDQFGNALRAQHRGVALQVPYAELTHEAFGSALHKLLDDPAYGENARKTSVLFKDNPLTPLENAVYWIEYVTRYGGATHLRTAANDLYWFQNLLLDVLLLVSCAVLVSLWVIKKVFVYAVCKLCCGRKRLSIDKKKQ